MPRQHLARRALSEQKNTFIQLYNSIDVNSDWISFAKVSFKTVLTFRKSLFIGDIIRKKFRFSDMQVHIKKKISLWYFPPIHFPLTALKLQSFVNLQPSDAAMCNITKWGSFEEFLYTMIITDHSFFAIFKQIVIEILCIFMSKLYNLNSTRLECRAVKTCICIYFLAWWLLFFNLLRKIGSILYQIKQWEGLKGKKKTATDGSLQGCKGSNRPVPNHNNLAVNFFRKVGKVWS